MYNRAFRAPNRFEEFYVNNEVNVANSLLEPEKITSYEAEVDQDLGNNLHFIAAGFVNRMDKIITPEFKPAPTGWNTETPIFSTRMESKRNYPVDGGTALRQNSRILCRIRAPHNSKL